MTSNTLSTSGIQCPESSREPCYLAGGVVKQSWALPGKTDLWNLGSQPDLLNENPHLNKIPRRFIRTLESSLEIWLILALDSLRSFPKAFKPHFLNSLQVSPESQQWSYWRGGNCVEFLFPFLLCILPSCPSSSRTLFGLLPSKLEKWAAKCILQLFTLQVLQCLPFQKRTGPRGPLVSWADFHGVIFLKTPILCFLDNSGKSVADTLTM